MPLCKEFEEKMIKYLWKTRRVSSRPLSASTLPTVHHQHPEQQHQISPSVISIDEESQAELDEKIFADVQVPSEAATVSQRHWWSWRLQPPSTTTNANPSATSSDPEKGGKQTERKLVMIGPIYAGCGAAMAACGYKFFSSFFLLLHSCFFFRNAQ
jgi:hypothetical protein